MSTRAPGCCADLDPGGLGLQGCALRTGDAHSHIQNAGLILHVAGLLGTHFPPAPPHAGASAAFSWKLQDVVNGEALIARVFIDGVVACHPLRCPLLPAQTVAGSLAHQVLL